MARSKLLTRIMKNPICDGIVFAYHASTYILKNQDIGCSKCKRESVDSFKKHIGEKHGDLEIIDIVGRKKYLGTKQVFALCRCKCGIEKEILLARVLSGGAKTCGHKLAGNLKTGREISEISHVDGTFIVAIDGRRKLNKNSETKITGVSYMPKCRRYRAYINFRRKQYYLGLYTDIEDAKNARKDAEEQIYGDFLNWYKTAYPENWERIENSRHSD